MNKCIGLATGDVIAFLHSDDFYVNTRVIEDVADVFKNNAVDSLYGNLTYVDKNNTHKTIRYWKAGKFNRHNLKLGWMPPHPTFFVKRNVYKEYGILDTSFKISMDYEIMLRFLYTHKISTLYLPETLVAMRSGGVSNKSIKNMVIKTLEDYRACKMHGIKRRLFTIFAKNVTKIPQFFVRENSF